MQNGYVAFLDVLGFRSLLAGGDSRIAEYQRCLSEILEEKDGSLPEEAAQFEMDAGRASILRPSQYGDQQLPDVGVFSDSVVLVSRDNSEAALRVLVRQCSCLLAAMLEANIALRGAISFGPYTRAGLSFGSFFAGAAIVDAYGFEKDQDWVGIMLAPSAIERVPELARHCEITAPAFESHNPEHQLALLDRALWAAFLQHCPRIPFHKRNPPWDDNTYDGFAVIPTRGETSPHSIVKSLDSSLKMLTRLKSLAPNPEAQAKYDRTHQWLYQIRALWNDIAYRRDQLVAEGKIVVRPGM
jgi:hypothetical protein